MADMEHRLERRRRRFQEGECAAYLAGLVLDPARFVLFLRSPAALVDQQDRSIKDAVAKCVQALRCDALHAAARQDAPAAGKFVETFEDHARVVDRRAVVEDQHRNLAERVLRPHAVHGIVGVGILERDAVGQAAEGGADPRLAPEGRSRHAAQDHHSRLHPRRLSPLKRAAD